MHPIDRHIGRRLRMLRQSWSLSAKDLDIRIGTTLGTIAKYERGARSFTAQRLHQLGALLGVEISFFFEGLPDLPCSDSRPGAFGDDARDSRDHESVTWVPPLDPVTLKELRQFRKNLEALGTQDLKAKARDLIMALSDLYASNNPPPTWDDVGKAANGRGFTVMGAFHPGPGDCVPEPAGTLVLVGNAGPAMWWKFEEERRVEEDPLDNWTLRSLDQVAETLGGWALLPFETPFPWPFQQWAAKAAAFHPSPLGLSVHPDWGPWAGLRGALVFPDRLDIPKPDRRPGPCGECEDKPCLGACPVRAFVPTGFRAEACLDHLVSGAGEDCMDRGCLARRACPVGREHAHEPAQARFHMEAFVESFRRSD